MWPFSLFSSESPVVGMENPSIKCPVCNHDNSRIDRCACYGSNILNIRGKQMKINWCKIIGHKLRIKAINHRTKEGLILYIKDMIICKRCRLLLDYPNPDLKYKREANEEACIDFNGFSV